MNKLWKVSRTEEKKVSHRWQLETATDACYVIARSEIVAKGLALEKYPDLIDPPHVTKKDIVVEEVDMSVEQAFSRHDQ